MTSLEIGDKITLTREARQRYKKWAKLNGGVLEVLNIILHSGIIEIIFMRSDGEDDGICLNEDGTWWDSGIVIFELANDKATNVIIVYDV